MTLKLARTVHLDESDRNIYAHPAATGDWAISGGFAFSNWHEDDLTGKARQAFANGWLSLDNFGRATFVAVARIERAERDRLIKRLAAHLMAEYGAPDIETAHRAASEEIGFMQSLCEEHDDTTLLCVSREMGPRGIRERFRAIAPNPHTL